MTTALVTGANRGIGLELCRQLVARDTSVVGVCRSGSPDLEQLGVEVAADVDVTDAAAVSALAERLGRRSCRIDLLINNAGILRRESLEAMDFDSIRQQFEVNAIGPLRIVHALLDRLAPTAKIAMITSRMGSIGDNTSGSRYGYRMSKAALNIASVSLARDLAPRGIAVAILHPGFVRTEMTGGEGLIDVEESASGLLARIDELTVERSGGFWHQNGERLPW